ncbi:putative ribosomal biogenesis protein LAS1 [Blattamonas nauphoetae]|uniref:Ribosomal biogenesis protein LAS1 n=1 Tax=Blattamonas nauphoetae TaxID=2049346 RepID=A0ABQ9Y4D7_9EUKA|nr:putative ribosomal biogenesis protein LAS1 [Blattamonas nauphoetae]
MSYSLFSSWEQWNIIHHGLIFQQHSPPPATTISLLTSFESQNPLPHLVSTAFALTKVLQQPIIGSSQYSDQSAQQWSLSLILLRFINGLVDNRQNGRYAISTSFIGKILGLPVSLVELRHESTHKELPSLSTLRSYAKYSLNWIQENYWDKQAELIWAVRMNLINTLLTSSQSHSKFDAHQPSETLWNTLVEKIKQPGFIFHHLLPLLLHIIYLSWFSHVTNHPSTNLDQYSPFLDMNSYLHSFSNRPPADNHPTNIPSNTHILLQSFLDKLFIHQPVALVFVLRMILGMFLKLNRPGIQPPILISSLKLLHYFMYYLPQSPQNSPSKLHLQQLEEARSLSSALVHLQLRILRALSVIPTVAGLLFGKYPPPSSVNDIVPICKALMDNVISQPSLVPKIEENFLSFMKKSPVLFPKPKPQEHEPSILNESPLEILNTVAEMAKEIPAPQEQAPCFFLTPHPSQTWQQMGDGWMFSDSFHGTKHDVSLLLQPLLLHTAENTPPDCSQFDLGFSTVFF